MELAIDEGERELLARVLGQHLGDLRFEIARTENYDMRQGLKSDEVMLKALLARLGAPDAARDAEPVGAIADET